MGAKQSSTRTKPLDKKSTLVALIRVRFEELEVQLDSKSGKRLYPTTFATGKEVAGLFKEFLKDPAPRAIEDVEKVSLVLENLVNLFRQRGQRRTETVKEHSEALFVAFKAVFTLDELKTYQKVGKTQADFDNLKGDVEKEKLSDPRLDRVFDEAKKGSFASSVGLIAFGVTSVKNVSNFCEDVGNVMQNFARVFEPIVDEVPFVRTLVGVLEGIYSVVKESSTLKETIQTFTKQVILLLGVLQQPSVRPLIAENPDTDSLLTELLCVIADFSEGVHDYHFSTGVRRAMSTQRVREELDKKVEAITNLYDLIRDRVTLESVGAIYQRITGVSGLQEEALRAISTLSDWSNDKITPAVEDVRQKQGALLQGQKDLHGALTQMRGSLGDQVQKVMDDLAALNSIVTNNARSDEQAQRLHESLLQEILQRMAVVGGAVAHSQQSTESSRENMQAQLKAVFSALETIRQETLPSLSDTKRRTSEEKFDAVLHELSAIRTLVAAGHHGHGEARPLAAQGEAQLLAELRQAEDRQGRRLNEILAIVRDTQEFSRWNAERTAGQQSAILNEVCKASAMANENYRHTQTVLQTQSAQDSNWDARRHYYEQQLHQLTSELDDAKRSLSAKDDELRKTMTAMSGSQRLESTQTAVPVDIRDSEEIQSYYVWVTESGRRYHSKSCRWGEGCGEPMLFRLARERYSACAYCSGIPSKG